MKKLYALALGLTLPFIVVAGLETGTYISDLVVTNPTGADDYATADDHVRLLKSTLKNTFPNINGAVTLTDENLNNAAILDQSNVFTGANIELEAAHAFLRFDSTGAALNERQYVLRSINGLFAISNYTDANGFIGDILAIDRTATNVDSFAIIADSITANGEDVATQTSGSFQLTFPTACTTTPAMTVNYSTSGDVVIWNVDTVSCTSDSTSFISGVGEVPAALRPIFGQVRMLVTVIDNGASDFGCLDISTVGTVDLEIGADCAGNWTASGSKALSFSTITYARL